MRSPAFCSIWYTDSASAASWSLSPRRGHHAGRGAAARIVIGEDEALLRQGLTHVLEHAGFTVVAAAADANAPGGEAG